MKKVLTIIFALFTVCVFAQTNASLSGKVTDAASGETLAGVTVSVKGVGDFTTNFDGYFDLSSLKPGVYTIVCNYLSYAGKQSEIEVKAGETTFVQINLEEPAYDALEGNSVPSTATSSK